MSDKFTKIKEIDDISSKIFNNNYQYDENYNYDKPSFTEGFIEGCKHTEKKDDVYYIPVINNGIMMNFIDTFHYKDIEDADKSLKDFFRNNDLLSETSIVYKKISELYYETKQAMIVKFVKRNITDYNFNSQSSIIVRLYNDKKLVYKIE